MGSQVWTIVLKEMGNNKQTIFRAIELYSKGKNCSNS